MLFSSVSQPNRVLIHPLSYPVMTGYLREAVYCTEQDLIACLLSNAIFGFYNVWDFLTNCLRTNFKRRFCTMNLVYIYCHAVICMTHKTGTLFAYLCIIRKILNWLPGTICCWMTYKSEIFSWSLNCFCRLYQCVCWRHLALSQIITHIWGVEVYLHPFLTALDGGEWSDSRPGRFNPRERARDINWIGDCVEPRAGLDAVVKRKIPSLCWKSNHRSSNL
jgi:hypothetical protein